MLEEARIRADSLLVELHAVRDGFELHIRFVKADMCVLPDAKHLQVYAAFLLDQRIVAMAFRLEVFCHPVGQIRVVWLYVHFAEEVLVHEIVVALRIFRRHADILIEIERRDF